MKLLFVSLMGMLLCLIGGFTYRQLNHSRVSEVAIAAITNQVKDLPRDIGDWQGGDLDMSAEELLRGGASGVVARQFVHRETGQSVRLYVFVGSPGPLSTHQPTDCFVVQGVTPHGETQERQVQASGQEIPERALDRQAAPWLHCAFRDGRAGGAGRIDAWWSWFSEGKFSTPSQPRIAFAGKEYLVKVYVVSASSRWNADEDAEGLGEKFLAEYLPHLRQVLTKLARSPT